MKKEFVTCEQALALKKLGFIEPCFGYYNIDPYLPKPAFNLVRPFDHEWCLPVPLKSQVFRWFRENYFLDSEIYLQEELGHKFYHYLILQLVRGNIEWKTKNTIKFKTYEEAEDACIDKLIELVKQQEHE